MIWTSRCQSTISNRTSYSFFSPLYSFNYFSPFFCHSCAFTQKASIVITILRIVCTITWVAIICFSSSWHLLFYLTICILFIYYTMVCNFIYHILLQMFITIVLPLTIQFHKTSVIVSTDSYTIFSTFTE